MIPGLIGALPLVGLLLLGGCARPMLEAATQAIDGVHADMARGPAPDTGRPLDLEALLDQARQSGPDFLKARLDEAGARLELDQRKAASAPRLGLALRRQTTLREGGGRGDASVALNWDLGAALFATGDAETLEAAERFFPVQAGFARLEATAALLDAYVRHEESLLDRIEIQDEIRLLSCRNDAAQVELQLGNLSQADIQGVQQLLDSLRRQADAAEGARQTQRREVLYLAGVTENARIATGADPRRLVPPLPSQLSRADCYARSGHAQRDQLLLKGAAGVLRVAKLQRFGRLDVALPADISPTRGLDLGALVSILVPIVDQGDGERSVQSARRALLDLALTADRNRYRFDRNFSETELAVARAATRISEARTELRRLDPDHSETCEGRREADRIRLRLARATLAHQQAETRLRLLCSALDQSAAASERSADMFIRAAAPTQRRGNDDGS